MRSHLGRRAVVAVTLVAVAAGCASVTPTTQATSAPQQCVTNYDKATDYFPHKIAFKHAKNVTVDYHKSFVVVTVKQPYSGGQPQTFMLRRCGTPAPTGAVPGAEVQSGELPMQSLFAASTTQLPAFAATGTVDRVTGVANAATVSNPQVLQRVADGKVTQFQPTQQIDAEKVIAVKPDVVLSEGTDNAGYATVRKATISVFPYADWLEETPLGRAEWGKVIGLLTGTEEKATAAFDVVESDYTATAERAKGMSATSVLPGQMYQGTWYMPAGGSYQATMLADAGGSYPWSTTAGTGSTELTLEQVLAKGKDATVWVMSDSAASLTALAGVDSRYKQFAAYGTGQVWSNDQAMNSAGANDYFESGVARPDLVLGDLVAILHPQVAENHEFTYYRKLDK